MTTEDGHKRLRVPSVFYSVDEGVKWLKDRINSARTVRISNIPMGLLEELLPALKGKDVKIILHYGAKPTEKMKEVGDIAIQKSKISSDFNGVEADDGSIYFSDVVFRVTWVEDKILHISTMGYNKWVEWFEMGWRYADKVE
jgi:hypothetical protein